MRTGTGESPALPYPVVVDASVGIKWVVRETCSAESIGLFDERLRLIVPDLFYLEVGNVLGKKADRGEITPEKAGELYRTIFEMPLEMRPSLPLAETSLSLAIDTKRALYDSLYLALTLSTGARYVTADQKYVNGLDQVRPDLRPHVLWVADVPNWLRTL